MLPYQAVSTLKYVVKCCITNDFVSTEGYPVQYGAQNGMYAIVFFTKETNS